MSGHTPGPWTAQNWGYDWGINASGEQSIAKVYQSTEKEIYIDTAANARLIAAAPEMYEALLKVRDICAQAFGYTDGLAPAIESAIFPVIAKATGGLS